MCVFVCVLQQVVPDSYSMPSSKVREIPIIREGGQFLSHPISGRTASPENCPSSREIPIQRDTGVGGRPFSDFFHRQDRGFGDHWPDHRSSRNSNNEPFSHTPGFHARSGLPTFPSRGRNDFWSDRRSPVQKSFARQPDDDSLLSCSVQSPPTTSELVQVPVPAESSVPVQLSEEPEPEPAVPVIVEPPVPHTVPSADQTDAKADTTDGSLHVDELKRRARSPSPVPPNMTALEIIEQVLMEGAQLKEEVEVYTGGRKEKPYLRLEELLTRLMLKLDRIESEGRDDIRSARREAVHTIQSILELLESRTSESAAKREHLSAKSSDHSSTDVDSASAADMETSCTDEAMKGDKSAKTGDPAAVKEMMLGSEVPC